MKSYAPRLISGRLTVDAVCYLPEEQALCFEVGMNDFLAKPIKLASLQRVLQATIPVEV